MNHAKLVIRLYSLSSYDLSIPLVFVRWIIGRLNRLRYGLDEYSDEAFEHLTFFVGCMAQLVVRETTPDQWNRIRELVEIPGFLGGLGE